MPLLTRVFPLQSGKGRLKGKRYGIENRKNEKEKKKRQKAGEERKGEKEIRTKNTEDGKKGT